MAEVIITLRIMPESPDQNLDLISDKASSLIKEFGGDVHKTSFAEVAFGLKSINIIFIMAEDKGSTEELENQIAKVAGVSSVEVTDVRRAIG